MNRCADLAEEGQRLRDAGKLRAARERFGACASGDCPVAIRRECAPWLSEVESRTSSLVIAAVDDAGADIVEGRALLDGQLIEGWIHGRTVQLDPGRVLLRVEADGFLPVDRELVVREGERGRLVRLVLARPPASPRAPSEARSPPIKGAGRPPLAVYILGGVSVIALGAFTGLSIDGASGFASLRSTCAPRCSTEAIEGVRQKVLAGDIALGVSVVAMASAVVLYLVAGRDDPSAARGATGR